MEKNSSFSKKIVIFLPISVPGSGKSFLMGHFHVLLKEKHNIDLHVISSDGLRKQLMDELASKDPSLTSEELFTSTSKRAPHFFNEELSKLLKKIAKNDQETSFLFIDKNNLPNALPRVLETLGDRCESLFDRWRFVALYPDSFQPHKVSNQLTYPFSINFMLNCLQRVQSRKGTHETLNGQGYKSANVLLSFINGYRNETLNEGTIMKRFHFHSAVKMPMTLEKKETNEQFESDIVELFNNVIHEDNPRFDSEKNKDKVQKFLDIFESKKYVFAQVSLEDIKAFLGSLLESCFNLFNETKTQSSKTHQNEEENKQDKVIPQKTYGKLPLYLGIFANDDEKASSRVFDYINNNLEWYLERHPDDKTLANEIKSLGKEFRFPNSIHVTSLFLGGNKTMANSIFFTEFKEGVALPIEVEAIVYVPHKIICGICFYEESEIKIQNEYPHLTMMISDYKAQNSSNVLAALYKFNNSPLKGKHSQDILRKQECIEDCFSNVMIELNNRKEFQKIYVIRKKETLTIEATTKFGYK